jgi:hypothetical protein
MTTPIRIRSLDPSKRPLLGRANATKLHLDLDLVIGAVRNVKPLDLRSAWIADDNALYLHPILSEYARAVVSP